MVKVITRKEFSLNKVTKKILIIVILVLVAIFLQRRFTTPKLIYNYVEIHTEYKNYIVVDKFKSKDNYYLVLYNKVKHSNKVYKRIAVTENIYYNVYFVGDTIK